MALGEGWEFHPLGDQGFGPAATAPSAPAGGGDQAPPLHPLTGQPSSMPTVGPTSKVGPGMYKGTQFKSSGLGRYLNRNANGMQFNTPAIKQSVGNLIQMHDDAKYYRTHGMGAALRTVTGLPQLPSHRNDEINSRFRKNTASVQGENPGYVEANVATRAAHPSADPNDLIF